MSPRKVTGHETSSEDDADGFFSTTWVWCTVSLSLQDERGSPLFIWTLRSVCGMPLGEKWPKECSNNWILHHDNAPCHTSLLARQFVVKTKFQPSPSHRILLISLRATSRSSADLALRSSFCVVEEIQKTATAGPTRVYALKGRTFEVTVYEPKGCKNWYFK
jgi:hypothetical protein